MGQLTHVLVHVATPMEFVEGDTDWIEGEPGDGPEATPGTDFKCVLFLPLGTEDEGEPRARKISRPLLMWEPVNVDGDALTPVTANSELLIVAPELAGSFEPVDPDAPGTGRWQIEGAPQPFGPPGSIIGFQATLKQVS